MLFLRSVAGLVVLVATALSRGQAQVVPLSAGQYDVTVSGLPGGESEDRPRCITAEHLKNPESIFTYAFSAKATANPSVRVTKFSAEGGQIAYEAETAASVIRVSGKASATSFEVDRVTSSKTGKGAPLSMHLVGKRTGTCKVS